MATAIKLSDIRTFRVIMLTFVWNDEEKLNTELTENTENTENTEPTELLKISY
jgi:hypothetical protein